MSESSGGEWTTVVDPTSGNPYYYNTLTKETSWTLPNEPNRLATNALATDTTDPAATLDNTAVTSSAFGAATGDVDDGDDADMGMDMAAFMSGFGEAVEQQEDDAMDMDGLVAGFGAAAAEVDAEPSEPASNSQEKEHEALYGGVEGGSGVSSNVAATGTTVNAETSGSSEWKTHKDPSTGREFYSNATTGTPYKYLLSCSFYLSTARAVNSARVTITTTRATASWLFPSLSLLPVLCICVCGFIFPPRANLFSFVLGRRNYLDKTARTWQRYYNACCCVRGCHGRW